MYNGALDVAPPRGISNGFALSGCTCGFFAKVQFEFHRRYHYLSYMNAGPCDGSQSSLRCGLPFVPHTRDMWFFAGMPEILCQFRLLDELCKFGLAARQSSGNRQVDADERAAINLAANFQLCRQTGAICINSCGDRAD